MPRRRQMPGRAYQIINQDERQAVVRYTYLCPYCRRETTVQHTLHAPDPDRLEHGGFYDILTCSECGETTDVRFWGNNRIH